MKDLSVSQSYLLCTLNESGKLPALGNESFVCILAGGLIDLIFIKSVAIGEDKKLCIIGELDEEYHYLSSLYTFIKESKPMKIEKLTSEYAFTFLDKRLKLLIHDIGTSLASLGCAIQNNSRFLGKTVFIPYKKQLIISYRISELNCLKMELFRII